MDAKIFFKKIINFFYKKEKIEGFENKLFVNESRLKNLEKFLEYSILEGTILLTIVMILSSLITKNINLYIIIGVVGFFTPFFFNYLLQDVLFEKKKREKEELLPDLLLEASIFCDETTITETIKRLANKDLDLLSNDFKLMFTQIKNGGEVKNTLERIGKINQSKAYSRTLDLFIQGYLSGAKMSKIFKENAEDLLETQSINRERGAVMLINKYTLIMSAGIIVPIILGLITGLVESFSFNTMSEIGLGLSVAERSALLQMGVLGTTIYLSEYALISSFFLAIQGGNKKQFWVYGAILLPIALIGYTLARFFY